MRSRNKKKTKTANEIFSFIFIFRMSLWSIISNFRIHENKEMKMGLFVPWKNKVNKIQSSDINYKETVNVNAAYEGANEPKCLN